MSKSNAMQHLRKNVRLLLDLRGMNQKQLAIAAGMEPSNLNRILNANDNVTVKSLDAIADALGVTASDLLSENLEKLLTVTA